MVLTDEEELFEQNEIKTIDEPKVAASIFRNLYAQDKDLRNNPESCRELELYNSLGEPQKNIVQRAMIDLLPEGVLERHFGEWFTEGLKYVKSIQLDDDGKPKDLNLHKVASGLDTKFSCDYKRSEIKDKKYILQTEQGIYNTLINFKKKKKSTSHSRMLEDSLCEMLSFDRSILHRGIGYIYDIDYDFVQTVIEEKGLVSKDFFESVMDSYIECTTCRHRYECDLKKKYMGYKQYNKKQLGEVIAEKLGVPIDDVVTCERICMKSEEFQFKDYFVKLSDQEQECIRNLLIGLYATL